MYELQTDDRIIKNAIYRWEHLFRSNYSQFEEHVKKFWCSIFSYLIRFIVSYFIVWYIFVVHYITITLHYTYTYKHLL